MESMFKEEILPRATFEDAMRFKQVSKDCWNRIMEPNFMHKHIEYSEERFLRLDDDCLHLITPANDTVKSLSYPDFVKDSTLYRFVHCDGLFLAHFNIRSREEHKIYLWNPFTRLRRQLFPLDFFTVLDHYGIGYTKKTTNPLTDQHVSWTYHFKVADPSVPLLRPLYEFAFPCHFIDRENNLIVLYRDEADNATVEDMDDDDEEKARIKIYIVNKNGEGKRVDMVRGSYWEPRMCGYLYKPSEVPVPNLYQIPFCHKRTKSTCKMLQ